VQIPLARPAGA